MAENYKEFLAAKILTDGHPVTYRLLSRALKTNVNIAKQMLYDFHTTQNAKKPKSVHATYVLTGRKRSPEHTNGVNGKDGDDSSMQSSPFVSTMPESGEEQVALPVPKTSILLVREEELEKTKAEFEEITSIHLYSLERGAIENMNMLSVCNQEIATQYSEEDPLERWRRYGTIHNPYIKRRTARFAPAPASVASKVTAKPIAKPDATTLAKQIAAEGAAQQKGVSEEITSGRSTPQPLSGAPTLKRSDSKPSLRRDKSDIFKSFAKTKPKAKDAEESKDSTPAPAEDETMQGMSEDEGDAEDTPDVKFDKEKQEAARKAREERQEKLRKMMEEPDDEDMPDAPLDEEQDSQNAALDQVAEDEPAEAETAITVQGGRRRGRRKVMKKKMVKDEEGYLVTKEEAAWESFSEDEPEPKKPKTAPKPAPAAKTKKTGKQGQGSIANFFKKA